MTTTTKMTPLRQRMSDDMQARNLGRHSQRSHIYSCKRFAAHLGRPDSCGSLPSTAGGAVGAVHHVCSFPLFYIL